MRILRDELPVTRMVQLHERVLLPVHRVSFVGNNPHRRPPEVHLFLHARVQVLELPRGLELSRCLPVADAPHEHIQYGEKTLGTTADQDLSIAEMQQKGLASAGYQGYWMPNQERRVQAFHEHLNDLMSD